MHYLFENNDVCYYFPPDNDHELEFVIEKNGEVIPIEVKSGNTSSVSLNNFINDFKPSVAYKSINGNVGGAGVKLSIPHYMIMFL